MEAGKPVALVVRPAARERPPIPGGPELSDVRGELLRRIEITDQYGDQHAIDLPVERPLTVLVDGRTVATLWTLGAGAEWLVLGYLWNRGLVTDVTCLESIRVDWTSGVAAVNTRGVGLVGSGSELPGMGLPVGSDGVGSITSRVELALPVLVRRRLTRATVLSLLYNLPQEDAVYRYAGSVHGAALFGDSELWVSVEDVSRRNALDTLVGWMALHGVAGKEVILFTTGRLTAETVMRAAHNGIGVIVSRKGITAACYDLAVKLGMTVLGHVARGRYICYVGEVA